MWKYCAEPELVVDCVSVVCKVSLWEENTCHRDPSDVIASGLHKIDTQNLSDAKMEVAGYVEWLSTR